MAKYKISMKSEKGNSEAKKYHPIVYEKYN